MRIAACSSAVAASPMSRLFISTASTIAIAPSSSPIAMLPIASNAASSVTVRG